MNKLILLVSLCWIVGQDSTLVLIQESGVFTIDSVNPEVEWESPNGGESFESAMLIRGVWYASDDSFLSEPISIYLAVGIGSYFEPLIEDIENDGMEFVELPDIDTWFARFKISAQDAFGNISNDMSDDYIIIGEPTPIGSEDVTVEINVVSSTFTIDGIDPSISLSSPNGGESFDSGSITECMWIASDDSFGDEPITISIASSIGATIETLIESTENDGTEYITLPEIDTEQARLHLGAIDIYGNTNADYGDGYFTIGEPNDEIIVDSTLVINLTSLAFIIDSADPMIELISPNGGEQFDSGETITVEWEAEDDSFDENPIDIEISMEIGGYFIPLIEDIPNTENIEMELPEADQAFVRLRLNATDSFGNSSDDAGDNYFILGDPFGEYNINPLDDIVVIDWGWGEYQMIYVENDALDFLNEGDEIHVIDQNGIITEDCADEETYGVASVASHPYMPGYSSPYPLYSIGGVDYCEESEYIQPGYVEGNPIYFAHYDESETTLNYLEPEYDSGNGLFGVEFEDTLRFQYFDESENLVYDLYETIIFSPDMIEGNAIIPVQFTVNYSTETSGTPDWEINIHDYEFNGSITSAVYEMGELITDSGDRIAAFVNNVCRGTIDAVETPDPIFEEVVFHLMVYGDLPITIVTSFSESVSRFSDTGNMFNASNRDLNQFNVYRNNVLVGDAISNFFYMDETTEAGEDYCYQIILLDDEGNELLESIEQCIGIGEDITYTAGDMNQDGSLNVLDIVMIVDLILNNPNPSEMEMLLGDLTNDGLVNVLDIVMLVDIILGI